MLACLACSCLSRRLQTTTDCDLEQEKFRNPSQVLAALFLSPLRPAAAFHHSLDSFPRVRNQLFASSNLAVMERRMYFDRLSTEFAPIMGYRAKKQRKQSHASKTHVLVVALDYERHKSRKAKPLTATFDAKLIIDLAAKSGIADVVYLSDSEEGNAGRKTSQGWATKAEIISQWRQMVSRCCPGDTLVFFYAGHGDQGSLIMQNPKSGGHEEIDGTEIKKPIQDLPDDTKVLLVTDACGLGSMCEFEHTHNYVPWDELPSCSSNVNLGNRHVVHLASAAHDELAVDLHSIGSRGGILTCALYELMKDHFYQDAEQPSVMDVFNWLWSKYGQVCVNEGQSFTMSTSSSCDPDNFKWPFWPELEKAMYRKRHDTALSAC